jgi:DNA topoisomerase I
MAKTLVIVESPNKAKTISRFLGSEYDVQASYGHVRDLPEGSDDIPEELKKAKWSRLGVNIENNYEPLYVVPREKVRQVEILKKAARGAERILLATDEDREGESISWHILQLLKPKSSQEVKRIVFHELTPEALEEAVKNPRSVDENLVKAQETRRILDRLYGYTLSPLLWRKVAPKLSAGRVQSVAVRLVVLRERERQKFREASYWDLEADLGGKNGDFSARLVRISNARVADGGSFSLQGEMVKSEHYWLKEDEATALPARLESSTPWKVTVNEATPGRQNPPQPFMTSTLQQEANRKLGCTARRTMQIAQELYEGIDLGGGERVGLITYMRTDSLTLAERALKQARDVIADLYGAQYLPSQPVRYKSKAKNAQEAHEAIRPTELNRRPAEVQKYLTQDQFRLYELIWKRTLACQMKPAEVERTRIEAEVEEMQRTFTFLATGKSIVFPGYLRVYVEGADDPQAELGDKEKILPQVTVGETLDCKGVEALAHVTRAPSRYTEASLLGVLEAEGVGRPSTYATIIGTIQDRGYVFKKGNELVPTFTAFAVTELLEGYFGGLVDTQFTARMEEELDEIAEGRSLPLDRLRAFYEGGEGLANQVEQKAGEIPFPHILVGEGLVVKIGRNGPYLQRGEGGPGNTANIPDDLPPADLNLEKAREMIERALKGPEALGVDPATGKCVLHKKGRFGDYLELAQTEQEKEQGLTPRRVTAPPGVDLNSLSEEDLGLLMRFPINLGIHPETKAEVLAAIGRYGAYLTAGEQKANVGDWKAASLLTLEKAVELLANPPGRGARARKVVEPILVLGVIEGIEGEVKVLEGRFGPYVTNGEYNATIPKSADPAQLSAELAASLLRARMEAGPSVRKSKGRGGAKSGSSRTSAAKSTGAGSSGAKSAAKKPASKSTGAKKPAAKKPKKAT